MKEILGHLVCNLCFSQLVYEPVDESCRGFVAGACKLVPETQDRTSCDVDVAEGDSRVVKTLSSDLLGVFLFGRNHIVLVDVLHYGWDL